MKINKKILAISASMILAVTTSVTAYAANEQRTPAEVLSELSGKTVESLVEQRTQTGTSYGKIADELGLLESFKDEIIELKKESLAQKVADGTMTQEKANEIISAIETAQQNCDGTGNRSIGKQFGAKFGEGKMSGSGLNNGKHTNGQARDGMGLRNGSCIAK